MSNFTKQSRVPAFLADNPDILRLAFGDDFRIVLSDAVHRIREFTEERLRGYNEKVVNPVTAWNARTASCIARTAFVYSLLSPFEHFQPAILLEKDHALNVTTERQGNLTVVIDNNYLHSSELSSVAARKLRRLPEHIGYLRPYEYPLSAEECAQVPTITRGRQLLYGTALKSAPVDDGAIDIWYSRHDADTLRVADPESFVPDETFKCLRHSVLLLGDTATKFVDGLTGHIPAPEVYADPALQWGILALKGESIDALGLKTV